MTTTEQTKPCSDGVSLTDQGETLPLRLCNACGAEGRERDRFCRRCGARQGAHWGADCVTARLSYGNTSATSPATQDHTYHRVSGALVSAITSGVSVGTADYHVNRLVRKVIPILISIPIWLIIILLSPLDAWTAARTAAGRI
ncbi:MAG TPA: hypothetical protein VFD58_36045 [Blastocatellia bacterium]|nr:hypothetical protein [Blastocatellia bacterium]